MVLQVSLADNAADGTFLGSSPGLAPLEKSARKPSIVEGWFAARQQLYARAQRIIQFFGRCTLSDDRFKNGMAIRKSVLGAEHVDRADANKTEFDSEYQRYITENAWGTIWSRPGLDKKTRHMLTIAMLAALGKHDELAMHIRATRNTGVTPEELREILLHVSVYAGVPAANSAFTIAKRIYKEIEEEKK
jgi:4-carboxymuconolactone decarboxylase